MKLPPSLPLRLVAICQGDCQLGNGKCMDFPEVTGTGFKLKPAPQRHDYHMVSSFRVEAYGSQVMIRVDTGLNSLGQRGGGPVLWLFSQAIYVCSRFL